MIIAVTGQMRSGTSMIAGALHRAGAISCVAMPAPIPPHWTSDWEDIPLSAWLLEGAVTEDFDLTEYLRYRLVHARLAADSDVITVKSPYLALHRGLLERAAEALGEELKWVVVQRHQEEVDASLKHHKYLDPEVNVAIKAALHDAVVWSDIFFYDEFTEEPLLSVTELLAVTRLEADIDTFSAVVNTIKQPLGV